MHLYDRAIQRDCLDPDTNDLGTLQFGKYAIQHAAFGPTVHPRIDRVPPTKALGQTTPLATMLSNIKNRIQHLKVRHADVATLTRQTMFDLLKLGFGEFHSRSLQVKTISVNTPFYGELKVKPGSKHSVMRSKPPCPVSTASLRGHLP